VNCSSETLVRHRQRAARSIARRQRFDLEFVHEQRATDEIARATFNADQLGAAIRAFVALAELVHYRSLSFGRDDGLNAAAALVNTAAVAALAADSTAPGGPFR
jgi:hypothetical protein